MLQCRHIDAEYICVNLLFEASPLVSLSEILHFGLGSFYLSAHHSAHHHAGRAVVNLFI